MQTRRTFLTALAGASAFALAACGSKPADDAAESTTETTEAAPAAAAGDGTDAKGDGVMTYEEFVAAEDFAPATIEAFVQGKQSWYQDKASIYAADADGGYFIYNAAISEEDYNKLVEGTKIKVTGERGTFEGEIEMAEGATIEIEDGSTYVAEAVDVTDKLGSDDIIDFQNQKVKFTDLTIVASEDADGKEAAFLYNWDGSGQAGTDADLYFKAAAGDAEYTFTVEYYLCNEETDVYQAVTNLGFGDKADLDGFLYWYQGANPQITSITVK